MLAKALLVKIVKEPPVERAPPGKNKGKTAPASSTPRRTHAVENRKKKDREQKKKLEMRIADTAEFVKLKVSGSS